MSNVIGFIGMGLMGGSIAKSIKKYHLADRLIAYNRHPENLNPALEEGVVDQRVDGVGADFAECDIIFLCCPIQVNIRMATQLAPYIKKTCIVTDVGSTKNDIHQAMIANAPDICFIGGHPMTGSEKTGYSAGDPQLFENICYVLAPGPKADEEALATMTRLVKGIKSIPTIVEPQKHDQATAAISHMPQVLSVALVNAVSDLDRNNGYMKVLAAGGFKDMSRIAASSPDMWAPIFLANQKPILDAIDAVSNELAYMKTLVERGDKANVYDTFDRSKAYRETMYFNHRGISPAEPSLTVDVDDTPGIIAKVATILSEAAINIKNIGILNKRERDDGVLNIVFEAEDHMHQSADLLESLGYVVHVKG